MIAGKCKSCKKSGHWKRDYRIFKKKKEENYSNSGAALVGVQEKIEEIYDSDKWCVWTQGS